MLSFLDLFILAKGVFPLLLLCSEERVDLLKEELWIVQIDKNVIILFFRLVPATIEQLRVVIIEFLCN